MSLSNLPLSYCTNVHPGLTVEAVNRGLDEESARARLAAQASNEQRAAIADRVLDNNGTEAELRTQVEALFSELVSRAAEGPG